MTDKEHAKGNLRRYRNKLKGRKKILEGAISRTKEGATMSQADAMMARFYMGGQVRRLEEAIRMLAWVE